MSRTDFQACLDALLAIGEAATSVEGRDPAEGALLGAIRSHLCQLHRLARAMEEARPRQWAPAERLTAREQEVVRWLCAGKTDRDIADILGISPRTVHKHLQRIYDKLGVETRTAAVMRVLRDMGQEGSSHSSNEDGISASSASVTSRARRLPPRTSTSMPSTL